MANEKRLIEPELLKTKLYEICDEYNTERLHIDRIIDEIDDADEVDAVEVVHSAWKHGNCMRCGLYVGETTSRFYHYCPNCGADMRGSEE